MLIGFIGTWAIILVAMLLGGKIGTYIDVPSVIMIFGGSITVVLFCFPMGKVKGIFKVGLKALFWKSKPVAALIDELVGFAEIARRDGILSLESKCREVDDPFVVQGLQMAVDGTDPELIEQVLMNDLDNLVDRHEGGKAMFDAVTKYAPAIGMIGTLVGLVAMLADLSDPSAIGAGLAVALLDDALRRDGGQRLLRPARRPARASLRRGAALQDDHPEGRDEHPAGRQPAGGGAEAQDVFAAE